MKTKTILLSTLAMASALLAVSCRKETQTEPVKKLECTALESYTIAAVSAASVSFDIASNTPWSITCSDSWLSVSPESSAESSLSETIVVKFQDNELSTSREATLSIAGEGISQPVLVKFVQAYPGKIVVTPFTDVFPKEGGVQEFTVLSNKPWTVSAQPSDWLSFEPASGEASDTPVTVRATAKYLDGKGHTAVVKIQSEDSVESFEASIEGVLFELEELDEDDTKFAYSGGTKEFKLSANVAWSVSASDPFVTAEKVDESTIKVSLPYSKWFGKKTFDVVIEPDAEIDGIEKITLPLSIAPASYIDNSDTTPYGINEDGSLTLTSSESGSLFMKTTDSFTYGNFVWTFSEFELTEGFFSVNNWQGDLYLMLRCGLSTSKTTANLLACGGTFTADNGHKVCFGFDGGWDNCWNDTKKFTEDTYPTDVTKITSIRMLIKPTERTGTNQNKTLSRKVWVNDVLVLDNSTNVGDVWAAKSDTPGFNYVFGIQEAVGKITISSLEIDTDYSKYND